MNTSFQMRLNRRNVLAAMGVAATVGLSSSPVFGARQITIRFNHVDGPGGAGYHFSEKLKSLLAERTNGRIQVQNTHSGQLGAERDMYDSMQIGAIEMGRSSSLLISVAAPLYAALDMPYLFRSQQHLRNVLSGPIGQAMHQEFLTRRGIRVLGIVNRGPRHLTTSSGPIGQAMHQEFLTRRGIRVLGIVNRGPRHLTTSNRPVRTPADLAGLKLRVPEKPVYLAAWRALGASPTPMAFPEVFTALQQGTIDGQENPLSTINGNSFHEVQRHLVLTTHVRGNGWMIASERFWQSLTEADRRLLQQAVNDASAHADEQIAQQEVELLATLRQRGMNVIEPDINAFSTVVQREVPPRFADRWLPGLLDAVIRTAG